MDIMLFKADGSLGLAYQSHNGLQGRRLAHAVGAQQGVHFASVLRFAYTHQLLWEHSVREALPEHEFVTLFEDFTDEDKIRRFVITSLMCTVRLAASTSRMRSNDLNRSQR